MSDYNTISPCQSEFDHEDLSDLNFALNHEWLVTDGEGGYAAASLSGANTRRYHGLFVPALAPPLQRTVLLSHVEESLKCGNNVHALSTNEYVGAVHPQGYSQLHSYEATPVPKWSWHTNDGCKLERRLWMAPGVTYIEYCLASAPQPEAELIITPLCAWKDYHSEMRETAHPTTISWQSNALGTSNLDIELPLIIGREWDTSGHWMHIQCSIHGLGCEEAEIVFTANGCWYYRAFHRRDAERGQDCLEDLFCPGTISANLRVGQRFVLQISHSNSQMPNNQVPLADVALEEYKQRRVLAEDATASASIVARTLARSAVDVLVSAPQGRTTILAGYPWFSDWGRDTMIALPGIALCTGNAVAARNILTSFASVVDQGMIPNRFPDSGSEPEYNTADASLWYFNAVYRWYQATGDVPTLRSLLYPALKQIVDWHLRGTRYGIHVGTDALLHAGQAGSQLTWMDARVGETSFTPRVGKPVELNALWHSGLRCMAKFAQSLNLPEDAAHFAQLADNHGVAFTSRFIRPDGLGLFDVVDSEDMGDIRNDESIRPNQIFAVSLPFAPLLPDHPAAKSTVDTVVSLLWTPFGVRTLAPSDQRYRALYTGNMYDRDSSYHQGTAWPWLLGAAAEAHFVVYNNRYQAMQLLQGAGQMLNHLGIGSISEVYDGGLPPPELSHQSPGGCFAQAWSVAELLRVWLMLEKGLKTNNV